MSSKSGKDPAGTVLLRRRDLLKLGLGGAVTAGLTALPFMRRSAYAMLRPDAPAKRVLVIYFSGGIRSSTAFQASSRTRYNPWGTIANTNTVFPVGQLLDDNLPAGTPIATPETPLPDAAYQLNPMGGWMGAQVARLREMVANCSVVGTWNDQRGDHYRSAVEESTGDMTGDQPGLLTRIGAGIAQSAPTTSLQIPTFHIEPGAAFGHATDALVRYIPVPLFGTASLPGQSDLTDAERAAIGHDWAADDAMRSRLDLRRFDRRLGFGKAIVEQYNGDRVARRTIGQQLEQPWFDVSQNPMAMQGTVMTAMGEQALTNAMLYELFVRALGPDPSLPGFVPYMTPSMSDFYRNAMDAALAVRLLQLGSPAIAIEMGGFDTHSGERSDAPHRFRFVGRLWATLQWLLSRIPEPNEPGRSMLDRTLVFTMSEFGRDPGSDSSGFNNGEGSDHGNDPSCYYLASAVMGGGIVPNRVVGQASPSNYMPAQAEQIPPRRLLSSALWALGLDSTNPDWGFADAPPLTQLWGM